MTHRILWLVGAPGAGKTTIVRSLLELDTYLVPKPKWTVSGSIVAAGHYSGGTFDGADTVPYNGVKDALAFWEREFLREKSLTIFDGDRFSNGNVIEWAKNVDGGKCSLLVAHVVADETLLKKRREQRGSNQNASWMKGRETKAARFPALVAAAGGRRLVVSSDGRSAVALAAEVRAFALPHESVGRKKVR